MAELFVALAFALIGVDLDPALAELEQRQVETIARVSPAVVAVFGPGGQGGGSGVLISPDGYALTNFHVTGESPFFQCGLSDGRHYYAVIVGLDPVGDIALIRLLGRDDFPHAALGDSDNVRVGDVVIAIGNPFLLATDFTPTVTMGIVSGLHRYQEPAGDGRLEYTDCIQTDAAVNPGNSGGPLFDLNGNVIGINGRISLEKRGRVNVGVAYAISTRQIQHFLEGLRGGLIVDHASLGATVQTADDGRVVVDRVLETSDAYRRGLREGDEVVTFAGRAIQSANDLQNVLGTLPKNWKVEMTYRRQGEKKTVFIRLLGLESGTRGQTSDKPDLGRVMEKLSLPKEVGAVYEKRDGFANYYFNRQYRDQLLTAMKSAGDFSNAKGAWKLTFTNAGGAKAVASIGSEVGLWDAGEASGTYKAGQENTDEPKGSGGLLLALDHWRQFLISGPKWFSRCDYAGTQLDESGHAWLVLVTERGGTTVRWLFDAETRALVGMECWTSPSADPCEIRWKETLEIAERSLPLRWEVRHGDQVFAKLTLQSAEMSP